VCGGGLGGGVLRGVVRGNLVVGRLGGCRWRGFLVGVVGGACEGGVVVGGVRVGGWGWGHTVAAWAGGGGGGGGGMGLGGGVWFGFFLCLCLFPCFFLFSIFVLFHVWFFSLFYFFCSLFFFVMGGFGVFLCIWWCVFESLVGDWVIWLVGVVQLIRWGYARGCFFACLCVLLFPLVLEVVWVVFVGIVG